MRRMSGRHENHLSKMQGSKHFLRYHKVPKMDRVKGSTNYTNGSLICYWPDFFTYLVISTLTDNSLPVYCNDYAFPKETSAS
jgi:hypothetical protein